MITSQTLFSALGDIALLGISIALVLRISPKREELVLGDIVYLRPNRWMGVGAQILVLAGLFTINIVVAYFSYKETGSIWGFPVQAGTQILSGVLYEEFIFRGLLLVALTRFYSLRNAVIISSLLFGLWHFKNILFYTPEHLISQILYAGLVVGPIFAYATLETKNIWTGVMLHYINNIVAVSLAPWILGLIFGTR